MNKVYREITRPIKTAILYYRVGFKRMTLLKAYRLLRYFFLAHIRRLEVPWLLEFSVTFECQAKCVHCSVGKYAINKDIELTNEQIKDVLDQAVRLGIPKVDFFGGEPLLREGIADLVAYGAKKGLYMSVTTNGWLMTKELTRQLGEAGISCINISLDSTNPELHDRLRRLPGLFDRVVKGIGYCHEEGIPCIVSTYVTREAVKNFGSEKGDDSRLSEIIAFSKKAKASGIRILFPIISGRWEKSKGKMFGEEEKRRVIDYIDPSFAFIEGAYSVKNKEKVCQSLSGKMFHLSPYGDIQICCAFPDTFGNIKNTSLNNLLKGMYSHPTYLKNKNGDCCSALDLKR